MPRPGGNPDLKDHQFTTERPEPLSEKLTIRVTSSMFATLMQMEDNREFIRQAIAEKLEREPAPPLAEMPKAPKRRERKPKAS